MKDCENESKSANIDAEEVWLLMGRDYRISRSIRLQWFFEHLNISVSPKSDEELVNSNEELEVISVLPAVLGQQTVIVPTTKLSFVGRQYRFVFCIDMSPSLASVDTETGNVLIDDLFGNMKNTLVGLVQPFCIPGSSLVLKPRLHLTVLAHTFINVRECQVLVQGYCVNTENVKYLLCQLKRKLQILENAMAEELRKQNQGIASGKEQTKPIETGLFYIIRDGLVALQLLPDNASAAIVVITDGVFNMENAHVADALLSQVRNSAAVCSFIQVGSGYKCAAVGFGYVPHCTLMQFIATATSGAYLVKCPPIRKIDNLEMNIYHNALFCWNFQRDIDTYKIDSWNKEFNFLTKESKPMLSPQTQQTIRYMEFELQTKISSVLTVRSREGYVTDGIRITKDNKFIEVKLVRPWKEFVTIEYIAKAPWPFESMPYKTEVIVSVSGPYEFLVDITSTKQTNHPYFRKLVLQKFEQSMKNLEASDQLIVQLHLFPTQSTAVLVPDAVAQGSPLFFMPPNSDTPILALQYGNSKKSKPAEIQFANFWKPVVSMDTRTWSKWLHCHRISILLQHDRPITKDLFMPMSNKNYPSVHCRAAVTAFNGLLKSWCSFTLLENHSYIKFIARNSEDKPSSFCVLRLKHKGLCIVIRLGFLAGTPGKDRIKEVESLKEQLTNLHAPILKPTVVNSSLQTKSQIEHPCIIFLTKQFERILVKYDVIPDEVRKSVQLLMNKNIVKRLSADFSSDFHEQSRLLQEQQRIPGSILLEYLFNQRWVWTMYDYEHVVLEDRNVAQILDALSKQRLHEGFHFCSSSNKGIISMVKEVHVIVDSTEDNLSNCCVIQYVIFPPHSQILKGSDEKIVQDDSTECLIVNDVEGNTQLVTEIWVEPQLGTMDTSKTPLEYIHGMEYKNIPSKIFAVDAQIITEMSTYMFLHLSCQSKILSSPIKNCELPIIPTDQFQSSSMIKVPFLFDVLPLLKRSRLILSLYPLMTVHSNKDPNDILLMHLSNTLKNLTDYVVPLSTSSINTIVAYLCQRCIDNNMSVWCEDLNAPIMREDYKNLEVNFICYAKSFGSRIIIIFVPKTIQDLDAVVKHEDIVKSMVDTKREKGLLKDHQHTNRRNLPIFIFECEYDTINAVPSTFPSFEQDVIQDYSAALSESALTPRHLNQKLPENRSKEIAFVCQAVYDHYFWALVTSVYYCLQNGYALDSDDVELSIELVCEEFTEEIDITRFIKTICGYFEADNATSSTIEDIVFPETADQLQIFNKKQLKEKKCSSSGSSSFMSSYGSLRSKTVDCDNLVLKNEIKNFFMKILAKYFTPVPNNPYFMFFSSQQEETCNDTELLSSQSSYSSHEEDQLLTSGPESDNQTEETDEPGISFPKKEIPLFLHLTSSCHYKSSNDGYTMRPVSVMSLPTCIEEILNKLEDHGRDIDLNDKSFKITLDLVCLTQPNEPEEGDEWNAPHDFLNRQNSSDSFYSTQSQELFPSNRKRLLTDISKDESYMKQDIGLNGLPHSQKNAVCKIIEEINWLIKDEIASALRVRGPVVPSSLDVVAEHVKNSERAENCIFTKHFFKFVTGIEKANANLSLPFFFFELESLNLNGYILKRVHKYYCVVVDNIEADRESIKLEQEKEQSNNLWKKKGHRRSRSDDTFQSFTQKQPSTNESVMSRSHSDTSIFLDSLRLPALLKHVDQSSTGHFLEKKETDTASNVSSKNQSMQSLTTTDNFSVKFRSNSNIKFSPNWMETRQKISHEHIHNSSDDDHYEEVDNLEQHLQPSPDFWLFMRFSEESVDIYLHRRRSENSRNISHQRAIYNKLIDTLDHICKVVNQRILLENLYNTNQCHNLLIADDDVDRVWDETAENTDVVFVKKHNSSNQPFSSVMHADFFFKPGHFECNLVWQKNIPIHKRLRTTTQVGGKSRGLMAIQRELFKFRISNRKNFFVIKDKSNNVFYFKINEANCSSSRSTIILDEEFNSFKPVLNQVSPTSSYTSLPKFEDQNEKYDLFERQESDQSALISNRTDEKGSITDNSTEQQECLQFSVYGIRDPDQTIKYEMIQMILNKLDSANLELINVSLARNPKCKLAPEDVEFIQAPGKPLVCNLVLCVSNIAAYFMHAIIFYLHQHLLLQYNTPRYTTTNTDYHFKNYTEFNSSWPTVPSIPSSDLFLYNRYILREDSNNGIGVIYLSLVDLDGHTVVAQPCYPSIKYDSIRLNEQKERLNEMLLLKPLDSLTDEDTCMSKTAMIQFSIWERGNINKEMLVKNLILHTQYALSDVFLEYDLLCTPLCFVPSSIQHSFQCSRRHSLIHPETCRSPQVKQGGNSTSTTPLLNKQITLRKFYSEPTTPCGNQSVVNKDEIKDVPEIYESCCFELNGGDIEKRGSSFVKKISIESSPITNKRPTLSRHSTYSENDFQEVLPGTGVNDWNQAYHVLTDAEFTESLKATDSSNKTWQEIEIQRRMELGIRKERRKFENGLSGDLHFNYSDCASHLFDELINVGNASVQKHVGFLTHQYTMETVMSEVVNELVKHSPDIKPKVFKGIQMARNGDFIYSQVKDHNESKLTADNIKTTTNYESLIPGCWCKYIIIGRNAHKWLQSMGTDESEVSDDEEGKIFSQEDQCKQKFKPLCFNNTGVNQERKYLNESQPPSCITPAFVPRQKFFVAFFEEKKITLYTYNFSNEVNTALEKQLKRLYAWNNVRSHLNNCLFIQKIGLFHHKHFVRDCPGKSDPDVLAFSRSSDKSYIIPLMRDVAPLPREVSKRTDPPDLKRLDFDNVFRDVYPTQRLHFSDYFYKKDLVKRQALQYLDVKKKKENLGHQQVVLKEIYNSWKQEGAHVPIAEDRLQTLKKYSRLLHYCNASLLFDIEEDKKENESENKNLESENISNTSNTSNVQKDWYEELKWTLVQQYIQYLQTLGLCLIQVLNKNSQKAKPNVTVHNPKSSGKDVSLVEERPTSYNLQKTSAGGIMVMEVFLEGNQLCYSLLAFSSVFLKDIKQYVSPKDACNFYRNCYEFKDLTHLQSFSYDFHIRMCQLHLSGRPSVFPKFYRIHKLMERILQQYPKPPRFSRLLLSNGILNTRCTSGLNSSTVYRYFITKATNFAFSKLEMSCVKSSEGFDPSDYLLFYTYTTEKQPVQFSEGWRTRRDTTDFDGFVAVHFSVSSKSDTLSIPFHLILANKKEFYPRPHLLTSISSALRGRHKANSGMDSAVFHENVECVKRNRVRFCTEATNEGVLNQMHSTESLKYTPAWSQNLSDCDREQLLAMHFSDSTLSSMGGKPFFQTSARSSLSNISLDSRHSDSTDSDISIPESFTKITSSTLETFLRNESKFVQQELSRVFDKLNEKFDEALCNCWRDLCWYEILANEKTLDEEFMQRKNKKKINADDSGVHAYFKIISQWRNENLFHDVCDTYIDVGYDEVARLLELVSLYHIRLIDKRLFDTLNSVSLNKSGVLLHLLRLIATKYDALCRKFVSRDDHVFICILNPENLDMFVLIDVKDGNMDLSAVYRLKPRFTPLENLLEENLPELEKNSRSHIESVITCVLSNLFQTIFCS